MKTSEVSYLECVVPAVVSFRVLSPFLAVTSENKPTLVRLPQGVIFETSDELVGPGFIDIKLQDRNLVAFKRDIEERAEPVSPAMLDREG